MQTHEICPVGFAFVVILHNIRYYFVKHSMPKIVQFLYFVRKIGLFYCNTLKCYIKPRILWWLFSTKSACTKRTPAAFWRASFLRVRHHSCNWQYRAQWCKILLKLRKPPTLTREKLLVRLTGFLACGRAGSQLWCATGTSFTPAPFESLL